MVQLVTSHLSFPLFRECIHHHPQLNYQDSGQKLCVGDVLHLCGHQSPRLLKISRWLKRSGINLVNPLVESSLVQLSLHSVR